MSKIKRVVIIIGPPCSGKGTHAQWMAKELDLCHVSTGDLLRAEVEQGTEIGKRAEKVMAAGMLVPDDVILSLIRVKTTNLKGKSGVLLDGFPRNRGQAEALNGILSVTDVIQLDCPDDIIVKRTCGRWTHLSSGRSYNKDTMRPQKYETDSKGEWIRAFDDITGEELIRRADDNEEAILKRLKSYHEQTAPLLKYYESRLFTVDAKNYVECKFRIEENLQI